MVEECLKGYSRTLEEEEEKLKGELTTRQRFCAQVRYGQLKLLHNLKDACSSESDTETRSKSPAAETNIDSQQKDKAADSQPGNNTHNLSTEN